MTMANRLAGLSIHVIGGDSKRWIDGHVRQHHAAPNVVGRDHDIELAPFARMAPSQRRRSWHGFQHLYIWVVYAFTTAAIIVGDVVGIIEDSISGDRHGRRPSLRDYLVMIGSKSLFVVAMVAVPIWLHSWVPVLLGVLAVLAISGLVLGVVFQLAHVVSEADFCSVDDRSEARWHEWQVLASVDFCQGDGPVSRAVTWYCGGLNYQTEHHLFPALPHPAYPAIAPDRGRAPAPSSGSRTGCSRRCGPRSGRTTATSPARPSPARSSAPSLTRRRSPPPRSASPQHEHLAVDAGAGRNAERGTRRADLGVEVRPPAPGARARPAPAQRRAAWVWRTRWAARAGCRGARAGAAGRMVAANGGLATTWNGRRGRRRSRASASTTVRSRPNRVAQVRGPTGVGLDGDHPGAGREQRRGRARRAGADIEDQVTAADAGVADESLSPAGIELVPSPPVVGRGGRPPTEADRQHHAAAHGVESAGPPPLEPPSFDAVRRRSPVVDSAGDVGEAGAEAASPVRRSRISPPHTKSRSPAQTTAESHAATRSGRRGHRVPGRRLAGRAGCRRW